MTIPVVLFVGGPADGLMLSSDQQTYTVGLRREPAEDGKVPTAVYYKYGAAPGYAGHLPKHVTTGCYLFKAFKDRAPSLVDGWLDDQTPEGYRNNTLPLNVVTDDQPALEDE